MMRYSAFSVLAFATSACAQAIPTDGFDPMSSPLQDHNYTAGNNLPVRWVVDPKIGPSGTVTLYLIGGTTQASLDKVTVIAQSIDPAKQLVDWSIPCSVFTAKTKDWVYGVNLTADADGTFQYSNPFVINATDPSCTSSSSSGTNSTTASSTASVSVSTVASTSATETTTVVSTSTANTAVGNLSVTMTTASSTGSLASTTATTTSASAAATTSKSAAAERVINGGLAALGGLVLAFAL